MDENAEKTPKEYILITTKYGEYYEYVNIAKSELSIDAFSKLGEKKLIYLFEKAYHKIFLFVFQRVKSLKLNVMSSFLLKTITM